MSASPCCSHPCRCTPFPPAFGSARIQCCSGSPRVSMANVFGPAGGPDNVQGEGDVLSEGQPIAGLKDGEGNMPYGDKARLNPGGEDPRLVGIVIRQSRTLFLANRTQTWGGTELITAKFDDARRFLEGACGQLLRQESFTLADGTAGVKFWNDAFGAPLGRGYGD